MRILYEKTLDGVCLQRCYGLDKILEIPGTVEGMPVTELDRYFFSQTVRGREVPPEELNGEPELCGSGLDELTLPEYLRKMQQRRGGLGSRGIYRLYRPGMPGYPYCQGQEVLL